MISARKVAAGVVGAGSVYTYDLSKSFIEDFRPPDRGSDYRRYSTRLGEIL